MIRFDGVSHLNPNRPCENVGNSTNALNPFESSPDAPIRVPSVPSPSPPPTSIPTTSTNAIFSPPLPPRANAQPQSSPSLKSPTVPVYPNEQKFPACYIEFERIGIHDGVIVFLKGMSGWRSVRSVDFGWWGLGWG